VNRQVTLWLMTIACIMSTLILPVASAEQASDSEQIIRELSLTHHDFDEWHFTPQVNDKLLIHNKANIAHSIYVTYPDGKVVNLGVQLPGETVSLTIPAAGDYLLQCWIHPVIRAEMTVAP